MNAFNEDRFGWTATELKAAIQVGGKKLSKEEAGRSKEKAMTKRAALNASIERKT